MFRVQCSVFRVGYTLNPELSLVYCALLHCDWQMPGDTSACISHGLSSFHSLVLSKEKGNI